ncbi:unnamed protein product [Orchesella dallaii]|uniref:C2H2-type domain-containing protein n=1 Tax=Orchesella dallaii TaxID=48710 RepID=A0ABP1QCB9_9HEXA
MNKSSTLCYVKLTRLSPSKIPNNTRIPLVVPTPNPTHKLSSDSTVKKRKYNCTICQKSFKNGSYLASHFFRHTNERPFKCQKCGRSFKTVNEVKIHQAVHSEVKRYCCSKCPKKYYSSVGLKNHVRKMHETNLRYPYRNNSFGCSVCHKKFQTATGLSHHLVLHSPTNLFYCVFCDYQSNFIERLKRHIRVHIREKPFQCQECGEPFSHPFSIKYHMKKAHSPEKWEKNKCVFCDKTYSTNGELVRHIKYHTGEKPFSCSICEKAFVLQYQLRSHIGAHKKLYSCSTCGKNYAKQAGLNRHKLRHSNTDPRQYTCDYCCAKFLDASNVRSHVNEVHQKIRPFSCEICGKYFSRAWSRNVHVATHFNEKRKCQFCNKWFSIGCFQRHLKKHNESSDSKCSTCGLRFLKSLKLMQHYLKEHVGSNDNFLSCFFCNKIFPSVRELQGHIDTHTGERPVVL